MANAKKRRRGVSKIRLTKANRTKYIRQHVANPVVREAWDPRQSANQNLIKVGILPEPNVLGQPKQKQLEAAKPALPAPVEEIFGVPAPEKLDRNPRRRVQSEEDQRYITKLLARHGDDFKAMERDIETNYWQHGPQKLKKMAETYWALAPDQRLVELPQ